MDGLRFNVAGLLKENAGATRDYDVDHYARVLRETFAIRLSRAFTPAAYDAVFADTDQLSLFAPPLESIRTVLTPEAASGPILSGKSPSDS